MAALASSLSFAAGAAAALLAVALLGPLSSTDIFGAERRLLALAPRHGGPQLRWPNTVLPDNVVDQRLPMVMNPHYGLHVFALGKNGSLFHKFQTGPIDASAPMMPTAPMSEWACLTPNASMVWGNDPTVALNADGRIELFVGYKTDSYDLWQLYQTDPKDPLAWTQPRGPTCICDAVDPNSCPWCDHCEDRPECASNYWLDHAPFTTSDPELILDSDTKKLMLYFRNFDGHLYQLSQKEAGNSAKWSFDSIQYAILE